MEDTASQTTATPVVTPGNIRTPAGGRRHRLFPWLQQHTVRLLDQCLEHGQPLGADRAVHHTMVAAQRHRHQGRRAPPTDTPIVNVVAGARNDTQNESQHTAQTRDVHTHTEQQHCTACMAGDRQMA